VDDWDKPGHDGEGSSSPVSLVSVGRAIRAWLAIAAAAHWANPTEIKRQFGATVDFVGDNRGISRRREVPAVSFTFGRLLVKFNGEHAEYDRIDPETVSWRKK
jgi:mRNA interferase HigB